MPILASLSYTLNVDENNILAEELSAEKKAHKRQIGQFNIYKSDYERLVGRLRDTEGETEETEKEVKGGPL